MSKKILSKIVLLISIFIVIGANFKNRSLEKLNEGYSEIIITKIRSDENIFSARIFYPSYIEEIRENDTLDLIKFNSSLNYLISDNSLYENFVSQLTNELAMSFKIYKIDRRATITKIFISGDKNKLEAKYKAVLATSSGSATFFNEVFLIASLTTFSGVSFIMSVFTKPGAIAFTHIL